MHIQVLILAAGFSRRMGRFKPLLVLNGKTVLARCVESFRQAGIADITVLTGHRHQEVAEACAQLGVNWVYNPDHAQGMFSSVLTAVSSLPPQAEAFFLLPVDIPLVRPWTIAQTALRYHQHAPLVAFPCFQGKRGHPPLISTELKRAIATHDGHGGLRFVLQQVEDQSLDVHTFDRNILLDMNRPEDFAQTEHRASSLARLDREEARALITDVYPISDAGLAHGLAVAQTAEALARALNRAGCSVDVELAYVCGLVHDLAKGQPRHEEAGGKLLHDMGLDEMASIVAAHRDLTLLEDQDITAKEVVYLADKLTRGTQRVSVRERFQEKLDLFSNDPEAIAAISRRLDNALTVQARMESVLYCSVQDVVPDL
ncbi:MAG: NTP transferase domain-containing protein [Desulfovermiculus sp.]|nr:NTP transferase domain-containing protein [Desulfovermiculus sp.]